MFRRYIALLISLLPTLTLAAQVESISAQQRGEHYLMDVTLLANVPEPFVREILVNPLRVMRVNDEIIGIDMLESRQVGVTRFRDHVSVCMLLYCFEYSNVFQMTIDKHGQIRVKAEQPGSDFEYGLYLWDTEVVSATQTRIIFSGENQPSFWVPSLGILKSRTQHGLLDMMKNIECEYQSGGNCRGTVVDSTEG